MRRPWVLALIILIIAAIFLYTSISWLSPRNSPKKAYEINKTVTALSQKKCVDTYTAHTNNDGSITVPILMYHYVENVEDEKDMYRIKMNVTPLVFEEQLKIILKGGYATVFVREIPELIRSKSTSCYPTIALTFDDGYEDFYTDVFPLLKKYNMKATSYVIANYIGRDDFMNEAQIKELLESNLVEIGSHTLDHPELTLLSDREVELQTAGSKHILESMFGLPVYSFSYPLGRYNLMAEGVVMQSGYTSAVTVHNGVNHTNLDTFQLSRVRPEVFFAE